jgi:hypothetical protein
MGESANQGKLFDSTTLSKSRKRRSKSRDFLVERAAQRPMGLGAGARQSRFPTRRSDFAKIPLSFA